jgi:hypothetical protein
MLRKGLLLAAAFVCLLPAVSSAQVRGPFEVEFAASGANGNKFNGFSGALNVGLGYFITQDQIEIGVRQSLQYTDIGVPRSLNGSTRVAADFHIPLGDQNQFLPFVGVNLGYVYGDSVRDTWEMAPEAGLKWFVGNDVFIYGQVEYQFFFRSGSNIQNGFNNGEWVYSAGIGFRF